MLPISTQILDREGITTGRVVGKGKHCGCGGLRYPIRWPDKKLTWCCVKGMSKTVDGTWRLGNGNSTPLEIFTRAIANEEA